MKKRTKTIIFSAALFLSIIGNILFLSQNFFNGTYYLIDNEKFQNRAIFSVDHYVVNYKSYRKDSGALHQQKTGYYSVKKIDGQTIIDIDSFPSPSNESTDVLCLYRKSIFVMCTCSETFWFICPAAIIVQVLWLVADAMLIIVLVKIKTPCRNRRQGKQTSTEGDSGGDRPGSPFALP